MRALGIAAVLFIFVLTLLSIEQGGVRWIVGPSTGDQVHIQRGSPICTTLEAARIALISIKAGDQHATEGLDVYEASGIGEALLIDVDDGIATLRLGSEIVYVPARCVR